MSLTEMLDKQKRLSKKIEAEETRVQAVEDRKLLELKEAYDAKKKMLDQWLSDCKNYLIDKQPTERANKMFEQFINEHVKYAIERDVGKVSKEFLARIEPKSLSTLISLYKLDGWFNSLNDTCAKPTTAEITEKEVLKAKQEYETLKTKIAKRRNN